MVMYERWENMIITFIFILAGIIFLIGTLVYVKKKDSLQGTKSIDKSNTQKMKKTLSSIWGIDSIYNQVISTNKRQHSIVVEIESIEYNLLHDEEKESVDRELVSISQMLKFPIQFLEVKQQVNIEDSIENIKKSTSNSSEYIKKYGNEISKHLKHIQEEQNLFERKNYIIISSFNNRKIAEIELKEFYQLLRYHLLNIKIGVRLLNDDEIFQLIYEQLHKGSKSNLLKIQQKGGLDLYATSKS